MAGNYPDVPSYRIAYDRDGTQVFRYDATNTITQLTSDELVKINDESSDALATPVAPQNQNGGLIFAFPRRRTMAALFYAQTGNTATGGGYIVEGSQNSTTGLDGDWTVLATRTPSTSVDRPPKPNYRLASALDALSGSWSMIRIRSIITTGYQMWPTAIHLYGVATTTTGDHSLKIWHPTNDARLGAAALDWGDAARGTSETRDFRVKNVSSSYTASGIRVARDIITDGSPSVGAQFEFSQDGGSTWAVQQTIGDLAPGALSPVLKVRRTTSATAPLSVYSLRLLAEATSWSS